MRAGPDQNSWQRFGVGTGIADRHVSLGERKITMILMLGQNRHGGNRKISDLTSPP